MCEALAGAAGGVVTDAILRRKLRPGRSAVDALAGAGGCVGSAYVSGLMGWAQFSRSPVFMRSIADHQTAVALIGSILAMAIVRAAGERRAQVRR